MATKELKREHVTVLVDNREQQPHDLSPMQMRGATLQTGDYTVVPFEMEVAIERKSLPDLLMCIGQERDRFERELDRLRAYRVRAVVVEASWNDLCAGLWRSKLLPQQVTASVTAWMARYSIPFVLAGDRASAGRIVGDMLFYAARDRWSELLEFEPHLRLVSK